MRRKKVKAVLLGVIVTKLAYLIPVVHIGAPLFGGATTAYIINRGAWGGLKAGFLKGIAMVFPAIILGIFFADTLAGIPIIGNILASSIFVIVFVIVVHSVVLGMVGGFISGGIAGMVRSTSVEETAKATANAANTASKATATAADTVDGAKQAYAEERDVDSKEDAEETGTEPSETNDSSTPSEPTETNSSGALSEPIETDSPSVNSSDHSTTSPPQQELETTKEPETQSCRQCAATVPQDVQFCPECGRQSPGKSAPQRTIAYNKQASPRAESSTSSQTVGETSHPVTVAAEAVMDQDRPDSEAASRLCQVLSDPSTDRDRVESALRDVFETVDNASAVSDAVTGLEKSQTTQRLQSAEHRLSQCDGEIAGSLAPVVEHAVELETEIEQSEREGSRYREAAQAVCNAASRNEAVTFRSNAVDAQVEELAEAFDTGELVIETPESLFRSAVKKVEGSVHPRTRRSKELLTALTEPAESDVVGVIQSTVEAVDEYDELRSALDNISIDDVRRQLASLDADLQRKDEPVYRHLADRIRELEVMVDRETVDQIQLYAIYQESRFYDRTLIPRLARSSSSSDQIDISQQTLDINARIEAIRTEYVNVRADHNHTIPNHFLELADSLCSRAQRLDGTQPQQAAGMLAAAAELLGHIEQLYERNEYSVMLRRLRG